MSEINIDVVVLKNEVLLNCSEEKLVEMSNGCICCILWEDLLIEVCVLVSSGKFDYQVIELIGIFEFLFVVEIFIFEDEDGVILVDVVQFDIMVMVVDVVNFVKDFEEVRYLQEIGELLGEEDECSVVDLFIDQIEFVDVLLFSKIDLIN